MIERDWFRLVVTFLNDITETNVGSVTISNQYQISVI